MIDCNQPNLIDSHCHIDFDVFDNDRLDVVETARISHIAFIIDPGVDLTSSRKVVSLVNDFPEIYGAVGIHPNESNTWNSDSPNELELLASKPKIIAIGEIGLDYYRDRVPRDIQNRVFREQLILAAKKQLPVIIHNRDASSDILNQLSVWFDELHSNNSKLITRPGVLHSFSADEIVAERALDMNFYIGITGPVTYPKAHALRKLVSSVPLDRILIETDAPFLSPQVKRGHRNEPVNVCYVAEKIAEIKQLPFEEVAAQTTINAQTLFQIGEKAVA